MTQSYQKLEAIEVAFDDENLVANAGLLLVSTLASKLGLADVIADKVDLTGRVGGANPASKSLTLIHAMVAGASHIDHVDMLRAGASSKVLPFHVVAPSTLGTYLRSFTFGHVRQLDEVIEEELAKAWSLGMAPGDDPLVIDIDSTICEVSGYHKQGAAYGYTKKLGYHPILAVRSDTGEVLHCRMRKGSANTQRGTKRFVQELIPRCRRAGANGKITIRFDSGYQSEATLKELERLGISYTMAVHANAKGIRSLVEAIDSDSWTPIDYTENGEAQVAETTYKGRRLIIRRTRLIGDQAELFPNWRYFGFVTDLEGPAIEVDQFHRNRARIELSIKDLKEGAGLEHVPSGKFHANGAWLAHAVIAHNLIRQASYLGEITPAESMVIARSFRRNFISLVGRLVNRSGKITLRTPARWPWAEAFMRALITLRALEPVPI
ncbi:IS1380 family transposase [Ferrimicrobium acidiphilum]|uniref:IS1380 family transposase n=4 Tax=Ferrimicrobium acidiphilum TaxID=121039 RepID=A0ABV3XYR1_9ACTN